jgi:hypothetical protein
MPRTLGSFAAAAMMRPLLSLVLSLLPLACSVTEVEPAADPQAVNRCDASSDCNGGVCTADKVCVASSTALTDLLIEVTRPTSWLGSGGVPFYKSFSDLAKRGGALDLELPPLASVNGRVMIGPGELECAEGDCPCPRLFVGEIANEILMPASDGSVPVDALFTPSERVLGIAAPTYSARFELSDGENDIPEGSFVFPIAIPPGKYDVYLKPRELKPRTPEEQACTPPLLIVNQPVSAGGRLDVILPRPQKLTITVRWPENNIKGSIVELLDPVSGRVISTASPLPEPILSQSMSSLGYVSSVDVWYLPVYTPDAAGKFKPTETAGSEIVRLTPPADSVPDRPTILAARDPTNAMGELQQTGPLPNDVIVDGLALVAGETTPVEAAVTLTAETLDGFDGGVLASFTRTVQVPPDGHFQVNVPPGRYRVDAVPKGASAACNESAPSLNAPCFASVRTTWEIAPQTSAAPGTGGMGPLVQGGKVVQFARAAVVSGRAVTPLGPLAGASVRASVTPFSVRTDLLGRAEGRVDPPPRAGGALVNQDGSFSFLADPGFYDLFVQPDQDSGFGWYVQPLLQVESADQDLGDLKVTLPVVFRGVVTSSTGTSNASSGVSDALIRAYTYVSNPERPEERAAIQVAETRADQNGAFKLLIPQKLHTPAPTR